MFEPLSNLDVNRTWTLEELSEIKASILMPSIVYLVLIMTIGVTGNAFVMIVYSFRIGVSIHRNFILVLAFNDFLACAVGIPFTIAESFYLYTYSDVVSCKFFRFILYYTAIASALTMGLIAFERFRKICRPLKPQMSVTKANRILFLVNVILSFILACPSLLIFGKSSSFPGVGNLYGTRCFVADEFIRTEWSQAFNVYLVTFASALILCIVVCYVGIARQIAKINKETKKRGAVANRDKVQLSSSVINMNDRKIESDATSQKMAMERTNSSKSESAKLSSSTTKGNLLGKKERKDRALREPVTRSREKTFRVTKMLTFVTFVYAMSALPHFTLQLIDVFATYEEKNSLFPTDNWYIVMYYSFFFNNLVNPFVYACMDFKFRRELKNMLYCCTEE